MIEIVPRPGAPAPTAEPVKRGGVAGSVIQWLLIGCALLCVVLVVLRHPYIGKRLAIMVPTLLIISVVVYVVVELPPGDFLTTRMMALQASGDPVNQQEFKELEKMFYLDKPAWKRYSHWMGLPCSSASRERTWASCRGTWGAGWKSPCRWSTTSSATGSS